jgi:hypothetical protein
MYGIERSGSFSNSSANSFASVVTIRQSGLVNSVIPYFWVSDYSVSRWQPIADEAGIFGADTAALRIFRVDLVLLPALR